VDGRFRPYNRLAVASAGLGGFAWVVLIGFFAVAGASGQLTTPIPFFAALVATIVASLAAIVSGHMARDSIRRSPGQAGKGLAMTALIAGYSCVVVALLTLPLTLFMLAYLGCQYQGPSACS